MAAHLVTYDLDKPGQNWAGVDKLLQAYPTRWRFQQSAWVIETDETEFELASRIAAILDEKDVLFVTRISETAAWSGYDQSATDWLGAVI